MIGDIKLDSDEKLIQTVRRSGIVLIPLVLLAIAVFMAILVGVFLAAKYQNRFSADMPLSQAVLLIVGIGGVAEAIVLLAIQVYRANRLFLTDERLVLLARKGIFHQDASQLSLIDVQDITVRQATFLSNLFSYGTITIETAGEKDNLIFKFVTDPHKLAQNLDDACEQYKLREQARQAALARAHPFPPPAPTG